MRFRLIDTMKAEIPVERMCALLGVSVSGYHAWRHRGPSRRQLDDMVILAHIRAQFATSNESYGSPRMHVELREDGVQAGRHRIARLMRDNNLKARQRRRFRKTTDSDHGGPVAAARGHPTSSIRISAATVQMRNGAWISATSGRMRDGCIWPLLSICIPGASSDGQPTTA